MMNNTYSLIISQSERAWSYQWARTLLALERRLNDEQRQAHLRKYAINVAAVTTSSDKEDDRQDDDDDDVEEGDVIESSKQQQMVPADGEAAVSEAIMSSQQPDAAAEVTKMGNSKKTKKKKKSDKFVPALMIIKQMPCTRAEQRRRLVNYWQVSADRCSTHR